MPRFALVVSVCLLTAGAASASEMPMHHGTRASQSGSDKAYAEAMTKMMAGMHARPTGDADRDFATMMLPHHQGAVDMAQVELRFGKDPEMLALARAVVDSQSKEIAQMRDWLAKRRK